MRKICCLVAAFVFTLSAVAGERNSFEVAAETSKYQYREPHMEGPIKISGRMQGLSAAFTHRSLLESYFGENPAFVRIEGIYMRGKTDYDGYLQDGGGHIVGPSTTEDVDDWYVDGRLLFGQRYEFAEQSLVLEPFLGLAYRFLRDNGQKKSDTSYLRESNYTYAPIGANFTWNVTNTFRMILKGEFDWLLEGKQKSGTSRFGNPCGLVPGATGPCKDMKNTQKKGFGLRAGFRVEQDLGKMAVFAEPFYRYWKVQNSKMDCYYTADIGGGWYMCYGGIEPYNTTREWGVKAGIEF